MDRRDKYQEERHLLSDSSGEGMSDFDADDKAKMMAFLDALDVMEDDAMAPSAGVKSAVMAEFKKGKNRKGAIWLNGFWAWFWPEGKPVFRTPAFQMAVVVGCVVIVLMAVNMFDADQALEEQTVAQDVSKQESETQEFERKVEDKRFADEEKEASEVGELEN